MTPNMLARSAFGVVVNLACMTPSSSIAIFPSGSQPSSLHATFQGLSIRGCTHPGQRTLKLISSALDLTLGPSNTGLPSTG